MSGAAKTDRLSLGFMETMEVEARGYVGGLLITNQNGRPLEFQCTTPVKPNRTQEILYGATLRPWVLGELIGSTLLDRVSIKPDVVIISNPGLFELRNHTAIPVACATKKSTEADPTEEAVRVGSTVLHFHKAHGHDLHLLQIKRHLVPDSADLREPLERVREALAETVKTVFTR